MKGRIRGKNSNLPSDIISQTFWLDIDLSKKFDNYMKKNGIGLKTAMMVLASYIIQNDINFVPKVKTKKRSYVYRLDRELEKNISDRARQSELSKNEFSRLALIKMLLDKNRKAKK